MYSPPPEERNGQPVRQLLLTCCCHCLPLQPDILYHCQSGYSRLLESNLVVAGCYIHR
ncbi:hypothetical protein DPMN_112010 [Dreissena polymorpha]|uniref:Uncharacterized protein n=1 Tax=Dreissena polymorpha TaxID=45954 RepID=A0A9D4KG96_DREPO|nr:hypothetical protein DPMN_112010 [Dreissena polymorpha]